MGITCSCHDCFNGSIDITVADGVPPYSFDWGDEVYTEDRSGLGALAYQLTATDANGCVFTSERISLTQPERSDWRMDGTRTRIRPSTSSAASIIRMWCSRAMVRSGCGCWLMEEQGSRGLGGGGILKGGGDGLYF